MPQKAFAIGLIAFICVAVVIGGCSGNSDAPQDAPKDAPEAQSEASSSPAALDGATRSVIYSLESDERIMQGESTMLASADEDISLVTQKQTGGSTQYFAYGGGSRKGPFASLDDAMTAAYKGQRPLSRRTRDCAAYNPGPAPAAAQLTSEHSSGGEAYRFNGSTFAPHRMVFSHRVTPDGGLAYLTASDNDKAWFEASDGRKVSFGGIPGEFAFSPDGRHAAVLVQGRQSLDEMNNLSNAPEKLAAVAAEMNKKYLYTIDGASYGPFDKDVSFWFARTSNDLFYRVGDQVFRNGSVMLTASSFDKCGFYPAADGRTYSMFSYENITFSDGSSYQSPLDVFAYQEQGKTVFRWLAFENKRDLVVYKRGM